MALIGILQQLIARPYNNYNTQLYHQNKWNTNSQALDDKNLQIRNNKKRIHINLLLKLSNRWKCNIRHKLKHQKIQTPFYTFRIERAVIVYSIHFNRHKKVQIPIKLCLNFKWWTKFCFEGKRTWNPIQRLWRVSLFSTNRYNKLYHIKIDCDQTRTRDL